MASRLHVVEVTQGSEYDPLKISTHAPFTQSWWYGEWQAKVGHPVKRFAIMDGQQAVGYAQAVGYPLGAGKQYWYMPYGPVLSHFDEAVSAALEDLAKQLGQTHGSIFVRFDFSAARPQHQLQGGRWRKLHKLGNTSSLQPRSEWVLDINRPGEELLRAAKYDMRRSVKIARRYRVGANIITANFAKYIDGFMQMQRQTAERNHFKLYPKAYYHTMLAVCEAAKSGFLIQAKQSGKLLASVFIITYGDVATYAFGGSDEAATKMRPTYFAQWAAIEEAQRRGIKLYNFGGINSSLYPRPSLQGPTSFKKKFGGRQLDYPDVYDYVLKPQWYAAYNLYKSAQNLRRRIR